MASTYGLREIVRNYQAQSGLNGQERSFILERVIAASIGYSTLCPVGPIEESGVYYNTVVRDAAEDIVAKINEIQLINTNRVMQLVRNIWDMRYNVVNTPMFVMNFVEYKDSMVVCNGNDLTDKYNAWIEPFSKTITELIRGH